jgi:carboxyl-terminal processing protease
MIRRALSALVLCLLLLFAGVYLGAHPDGLPGVLRDPLVGDQNTRVVREAMKEIDASYYRKVPEAALSDTAVKGMVAGLHDRFSNYFTPKEYASFQEQQRGAFAGVGITVSQHKDGLLIMQVFPRSPAQKAKVEVGDVIIAVDGTSLKGRKNDDSVARIKGRVGTDVTLRLRSKSGKQRDVTLKRAEIPVQTVTSKDRTVNGRKVAVIKLADFGEAAHARMAPAVRKALKDKVAGIVLDLRGNPGGLVTEAQLVASEFLSDGKIVTTKGRSVPERTLSATGDPIAPKTPLVVLVDRNSASAAEIVAGALQDNGRAKLVGTRTFGKGVFQQVIELSNGGALDITAGQYFTPKGRNLGGRGTATGAGLSPDIQAPDDPKTAKVDETLDKGLQTVAAEAA